MHHLDILAVLLISSYLASITVFYIFASESTLLWLLLDSDSRDACILWGVLFSVQMTFGFVLSVLASKKLESRSLRVSCDCENKSHQTKVVMTFSSGVDVVVDSD